MGAGEAAAGEQVRLLFFRSGGERFALDVAYVREIIPPLELTPVPFVPDTVDGIANHRGTICTIVRFARLAGLGEDRTANVVLLRLPEMAIGLSVEAIEGIETLPSRLLATEPVEGSAVTDVAFLRRAADARGRLMHAVDADVLIDTIYQIAELGRTVEA